MSIVGDILSNRSIEPKTKQPQAAEQLSLDKFSRYVEAKRLEPGFFVYDEVKAEEEGGEEKIVGVTRFEGTTLGIASADVSPEVADARALVMHLLREQTNSLQVGDIIKVVGQDHPEAEGLVFRIDGRVDRSGGAYVFAKKLDSAPVEAKLKTIILPAEFKELDRSEYKGASASFH